jgi:hypothetical protein
MELANSLVPTMGRAAWPAGLGFAQPELLWFATAAGIPLLIHLLHRRRWKRVAWGAMEHLRAALRKHARRLRLEQWLLLLVRMAVVVLVALAAARPWSGAAQQLPAAKPQTHHVLVLDVSYSMGAEESGQRRLARARELAAAVVQRASPGDGFSLVAMGGTSRPVIAAPVLGREEFLAEVRGLPLEHMAADAAGALAAASRVVREARRGSMALNQAEVYVLTDLQRNTWSGEARQAAAVRAAVAELLSDARLSVLDVGQAADNVAVMEFASAEGFAVAGHDAEFRAGVRRFGGREPLRMEVEYRVGDAVVQQQHVELPPDGAAVLPPLVHRFATPGEALLEVRLTGDRLSIDNHRWLAVRVRDQVRALLVDGQPSAARGGGETAYLALALRARRGALGAIDAEVISPARLRQHDLSVYDVVFLCNVTALDRTEAEALRRFVQRGGGLVTFLGDAVDVQQYNAVLTAGPQPLLPARIGPRVAQDPADWQELDPLEYRHPLLEVFRDNEQVGLQSTPIYKYYRLEVPADGTSQVALRFAGGDPLIVSRRLGRGWTLLVATSAATGPSDDPWSALPLLPNYVPLVREMVRLVAASQLGQRNVLAGEPLADFVPDPPAGAKPLVRGPAGTTSPLEIVPVAGGVEFAWSQTQLSGPYTVEGLGPPRRFAVNVDLREADLARVEAAELRAQWNAPPERLYIGAQLPPPAGPASSAPRATPAPQQHHVGLLGLLVLLLVGETLLSAYWGRQQA